MDARTGCEVPLDSAGIRLCGKDGDLCMLCEIDRQAAEIDRLRARVEELVRRGWVRIPYRMHEVEYSRQATSVDDLFAALDAAREGE